ncbi:MAG: hypothetical protein IJL06_10065 [Kiritimatiellae bacterium]|nr:hypothetical protein [Kiritimatiellia bacterium]
MIFSRFLLVFAAIGIAGIAFSGSAEAGADARRPIRNGTITDDVESPVVAIGDAETILRVSLEFQHASKVDYRAISETVVRDFGWTPEKVRDFYLNTAFDSEELQQMRRRALGAYMELSDPGWFERIAPLFSDADETVRRSSLSLALGKQPDTKSKLGFFAEQIERLSETVQFRKDVYSLSGHFHGIVLNKFVPERDTEDILTFYRGLADKPPFAECAVSADSFLARFDPQWPTSPDRRELLRRWKDDSSLSEYVRTKMNEAWTSCPPDSVFSADAVPESETVRPKPEPSETRFGDGGLDSRGDSPQSADSGRNAASPAIWIFGAAALALAAALACFVIRRNRGR